MHTSVPERMRKVLRGCLHASERRDGFLAVGEKVPPASWAVKTRVVLLSRNV
jgi:hypothetical protein